MDDVIINKSATIERCVKRVKEEHQVCQGHLDDDILRQDSILLNLQRACEASIDLATHIVRRHRLGAPNDTRETFTLLYQSGWMTETLKNNMQSMVAFRNIAVHEYIKLDTAIIESIINHHLDDFLTFTQQLLTHN